MLKKLIIRLIAINAIIFVGSLIYYAATSNTGNPAVDGLSSLVFAYPLFSSLISVALVIVALLVKLVIHYCLVIVEGKAVKNHPKPKQSIRKKTRR